MKKIIIAVAVLLCFFLGAQAYGQDASLSGTVLDPSNAVIPGASVTATNDNTGVNTAGVSNAAGVYNFPKLLPGIYTLKAAAKGFQPRSYTKVTLGAGQQAKLNFDMAISGVDTQVEVSTTAEQLLLDAGSSVGDVLSADTVEQLPLVNRNALDLVQIMSGVVMADDTIFNANSSSFAGVGAAGVNIQRDGVTVNDVRWPAGINAATRVNPDLVGEFRLILAPVDAEAGRGNAQIQIQTKSGTNAYHGNLVWNAQNTAGDPNTWENNRNGADPPWRNMHEYSASLGGPIRKNKTFFFALFDGQLNKIRTPFNTRSLTPCAKKGIFRFFDNWNNGNSIAQQVDLGTPVARVVDTGGNPLAPPYLTPNNPASGAHNGQLRYAYIFGNLRSNYTDDTNCSHFNAATDVTGAAWDTYRTKIDPTGFVQKFLDMMPTANNYQIGDGLNTAGHRWSRTLYGADNLFGVGEDTYRRQINFRFDHNFNDNHRANGSWSWEKSWADDNFKNWPDGFGGKSERRPMVLTANLVSSLRATLLNEARFGMSRTGSNIFSPYTNPNTGTALRALLPNVNNVPVVTGLGAGSFGFGPESSDGYSNFYGGRGILSYSGVDNSPRWTFGDTMSWTKSTHSLRFGGEYRYATSEAKNQWTGPFWAGYNSYPYAGGGEIVAPVGIDAANLQRPGLTGNTSVGNVSGMEDMLNFFAGSLGQLRQWRYINSSSATDWNDTLKDQYLVRNVVTKEFSLFFKDDWKIRPSLTLNLGIRYDYYGVPYLSNGLTTAIKGGSDRLFGLTGSAANWFAPMTLSTASSGANTELQFIGPGTSNPNSMLYNRDWNNFGPAVGFAWQLPWLGKGKTTIRGGYQINYLGLTGRASDVQTVAGQAPGTVYSNQFTGSTATTGPYMDLTDLASIIPVPMPAIAPGIKAFPLTDRQQDISAFSPDYKSPYIQNLTFTLSRTVTSNLTVDLRYVGTISRKLYSSKNINMPNFLTNGLLQAFNEARAGGNPKLLDDMFMGASSLGFGVVNGTTYTGAQALRDTSWGNYNLPLFELGWGTPLNQALAQGNYAALANALSIWSGFFDPRGSLLRLHSPENFIKANPQFNNVNIYGNDGYSNYHSFQGQITLRPTHGVSFQSTYTWSKNLGITGNLSNGAGRNPLNLSQDYSLLASNRTYNWVTYGTFDLPFGPGRLLGGKSTGALAKVLGGWQTSWISDVQAGAPLSIGARAGTYGVGTPDVVGPFDYSVAGTFWPDGARNGNFFANRYVSAPDPQCAGVWAGGQSFCNTGLLALKDTKTNQIVLQNSQPGTIGNMGLNTVTGPMRWQINLAISKAFQITESKSFRLRVDATNILNHPSASGTLGASGTRIVFPTAPTMSINSGTFGSQTYKVGGRTFQFLARFDF